MRDSTTKPERIVQIEDLTEKEEVLACEIARLFVANEVTYRSARTIFSFLVDECEDWPVSPAPAKWSVHNVGLRLELLSDRQCSLFSVLTLMCISAGLSNYDAGVVTQLVTEILQSSKDEVVHLQDLLRKKQEEQKANRASAADLAKIMGISVDNFNR